MKKSILHLLRKCLDDSDDEVRERAYFYIVLIEKDLGETVLDEELMIKEDDGEEELIELREFVFDQETNINIDALEAYLNANKA